MTAVTHDRFVEFSMGFTEDLQYERMEWADNSVGSILGPGVGGGMLIAAGLMWPDLFGLPGLMMIAIGAGGFLVLWALVRAARKVIGELEYRDNLRRQQERLESERLLQEEHRQLAERRRREQGDQDRRD
jgi:hypothetical protein